MHLLYTRFKSVSSQLAPLLGELERRAKVHPDELSALLSECHSAYFSARKTLLVGRLTEEIKGLDPTRTELVELVRSHRIFFALSCFTDHSFRLEQVAATSNSCALTNSIFTENFTAPARISSSASIPVSHPACIGSRTYL